MGLGIKIQNIKLKIETSLGFVKYELHVLYTGRNIQQVARISSNIQKRPET